MTEFVRTVSLDDLTGVLQQRGFRAEKLEWAGGAGPAQRHGWGDLHHRIRQRTARRLSDFTYFANFRLEGLPLAEICEKWNMGRRFARAHGRDGILNIETGRGAGHGTSRTIMWP